MEYSISSFTTELLEQIDKKAEKKKQKEEKKRKEEEERKAEIRNKFKSILGIKPTEKDGEGKGKEKDGEVKEKKDITKAFFNVKEGYFNGKLGIKSEKIKNAKGKIGEGKIEEDKEEKPKTTLETFWGGFKEGVKGIFNGETFKKLKNKIGERIQNSPLKDTVIGRIFKVDDEKSSNIKSACSIS